MKMTLIQAGGYIGRQKTAEKDVNEVSHQLDQEINALVHTEDHMQNAKVRDLEKYYLQVDDKAAIAINIDKLTGELKKHVTELRKKLNY
ncbi:hypothetical protein [Pedobacter gandavensis]|uniref:hypothetical protein n=1 Tax=Pedobacter gandavensis TaxID=2679963 RepID=UPI0029305DA3|nr:hypothetical protein [Pedobacter gandavensis]